ncbi:AraC family transcriptional regulator [Paenibacillus sp. PAMC21692]|uniref:AraC family transcriptional regulator n=1 Tax=Paenibacillus sp. PAMC21692 TaxID=2762320 RepID=UPI00164EBE17|nr:AraC family transcriptional regulator [Paenibacillus sp. PAMC21692]QNK56397.1 helix-turn-helix transcriptional regulator [Paenibacillus sp. PAMC21692]
MEIINSSINQFLEQMKFAYRTKDQTEQMRCNGSTGDGFVMRLVPRPDMLIIITNCTLAEHTQVNFAFEEAMVELMICFQGEGSVEAAGVHGTMRPNTITLGLMNDIKGTYFFAGDRSMITLGIHISAATFDRYLTGLDGSRSTDFKQLISNRPLFQLQQSILDTPILQLASRIMNIPYTHNIPSIALESLALEILSYSFQSFVYGSNRSNLPAAITKSELQRLQHAKEVLLQRMDNPPSLLELSRIIGMNDFKLKHHFKAVFGTTVFGYLRDIRMEKAILLLQDGMTSVSMAAAHVGYANASYFASAFRKRYGMNPSEFLHYANNIR